MVQKNGANNLFQKLVFDIPVFHPLVDPVSGELDVRRAFTKWR